MKTERKKEKKKERKKGSKKERKKERNKETKKQRNKENTYWNNQSTKALSSDKPRTSPSLGSVTDPRAADGDPSIGI